MFACVTASFIKYYMLRYYRMINSQNNSKKTIGILGGMGPAASVRFYDSIVNLAQKKYNAEQDDDYPPMVLYNLTLHDFDETGSIKNDSIKEQLISGVQLLEEAGADFIVIACNTVHFYFKDMQSAVKIPIINLIQKSVDAVKEKSHKTIGLLTSDGTRELGLYTKAFSKEGLDVISVNGAQQKILNKVILHVMSGIQGDKDEKSLKIIIDNLVKQGAQAVIIGCTELPLAIGSVGGIGVDMFDSLEILAESALEQAYK